MLSQSNMNRISVMQSISFALIQNKQKKKYVSLYNFGNFLNKLL